MRIKKWCLFLLALAVAAASYGCRLGGERRPAPEDKTPAPIARPTPSPVSPTGEEMAEKAAETAASVKGVKSAWALIITNVALIGLDLEDDALPEETDEIKRAVVKKVKDNQKNLADVLVSADPDAVRRIRRVANGLQRGEPFTTFADEVALLLRQMKPASTKSPEPEKVVPGGDTRDRRTGGGSSGKD
ncbi:MAG: YhcN/YlaJ family sporulation lipoprotein [Firmicutes bacterium]|nr:YhcN/YlaJ family sporulation lipoprotein [Bacillota bacterium]